jgi:hypothetical protein
MEKGGIFYGSLVNFMPFWYILWPFGNLGIFSPRFGILCREKSGNPGREPLTLPTFVCAYVSC